MNLLPKATIFALFLLIYNPLASQSTLDFQELFANPHYIHLDFKANELEVDQEENIYLTDTENHRIYKLLSGSDYDSLISIGGNGSRDEGLLFPKDLTVRNQLNLFLLDEGNRRVLLLNQNLKLVRELSFMGKAGTFSDEVINPTALSASFFGDLFLLNSDENTIHKFTSMGKEETVFGGVDYGWGSLSSPKQIEINENGLVFVSQPSEENISIFDHFGLFQYQLHPMAPFSWESIMVSGNFVICYSSDRAWIYNLSMKEGLEPQFSDLKGIQDVAISSRYFYILDENRVTLFSRLK